MKITPWLRDAVRERQYINWRKQGMFSRMRVFGIILLIIGAGLFGTGVAVHQDFGFTYAKFIYLFIAGLYAGYGFALYPGIPLTLFYERTLLYIRRCRRYLFGTIARHARSIRSRFQVEAS